MDEREDGDSVTDDREATAEAVGKLADVIATENLQLIASLGDNGVDARLAGAAVLGAAVRTTIAVSGQGPAATAIMLRAMADKLDAGAAVPPLLFMAPAGQA